MKNLTQYTLLVLFYIILLTQSLSKDEKESITREELEELLKSKDFEELQEDEDSINLKGLFSGDECLPSNKDTSDILKNIYGVTVYSPDKNLRFIVGKCNPVLLVPGIYSTKLVAEINCKGLYTYEKETTFRDLRIFCGDTLCPDETVTLEEHYLFISLLDKAFSILGGEKDKYSSCLGYIMNFFQNKNECPKLNGKSLCYYSEYIKVGFYGSTPDTINKGKCGLEAVKDVIQSGIDFIDSIVNNIGAAKVYNTMSKILIKRGYSEGFSLGGLPNDYRRYLATNNFSTKVFRRQIENLYANTGKPVVIIAHSYGTLLALTNLVKPENKDLLPKIKKFIAIGPPFAGAAKLLETFLHGMDNFNKSFNIIGHRITITNYNKFGQLMMYKSLPTVTELRPLSGATDIFINPTYSKLGDALRERIAVEKACRKQNCSSSYISTNSRKFDAIFKGYFPSLTETECAYESSIGGNQDTFNRKCYTELYNVADCPTIVVNSSSFNPNIDDVESYCGQKDKTKFYYQGRCDNSEGKQCVDDIYSTKGPYVYQNSEAVNYLIDRFNSNFASKFTKGTISKNYFDTIHSIREGQKLLLSYHNDISLIKDLPAPQVDTDLVYGTFAKTPTAFKYKADNFFEEGDIYKKGGDDTVPTWSSLLTGLKWIYDKKTNPSKYPKKYKLVEYCSRLSKSDKYKLNPEKDQAFIALGCDCLNDDNEYKSKIESCTHSSMINDESNNSLIDYIISVIDDPKEGIYSSDDINNAVKNYDKNRKYEKDCNAELNNILLNAK